MSGDTASDTRARPRATDRDVKPDNVLVRTDLPSGRMQCVLADFGCSKQIDPHAVAVDSPNDPVGEESSCSLYTLEAPTADRIAPRPQATNP